MKSALVALVLALAAAFGVGACGDDDDGGGTTAKGDGELVIGSFGGVFGQGIQLGFIDEFEKETGIDVTLLPTVDWDKSIVAMEAGKPPLEDIHSTVESLAAQHAADGWLAPIDYDQFDEQTLEELPEKEKLKYAVGHGVAGTGVCYNKDSYPDEAPKNWADFWDVEKFPGKRTMEEFPSLPATEIPVIADGVDPKDVYPVDLNRSFEKLAELRPHIPQFAPASAVPVQQLADGQVDMAACFDHRLQPVIDSGLDNLAISYDQMRVYSQAFGVWKDAKNKENAMKFLAFMAKKENQARYAQVSRIGPANPAAFELIPDDIEARFPTAPAHKTVWFVDEKWLGENQEEINDRWEEFVGGS